MVYFVCDICGQPGVKRYSHIREGIGCPVCSNKKIVSGINDVWTTDPEVASLLANPDEGRLYSRRSHKKLEFRCSACGQISVKRLADITKRGFHCPYCDIGVSYPNRVMMAVLDYVGANYSREAIFVWSNKKRYDFFIYPDVLIEVHGKQHYFGFRGGSFTSYESIMVNDANKIRMAFMNGIKHYIIINASESNINYISSSIMNSKLYKMYDLSDIDWNLIDRNARRSLYNDIVSSYNSGMDVTQISKWLHIDCGSIRVVLKTAANIGDCCYDSKVNSLKAALDNCTKAHEENKKPVRCITTGKEFPSLNAACECYHVNPKGLSRHLTGHSESSGRLNGEKLQWEYISKEAY